MIKVETVSRDVPALLRELARLRAENRQLRGERPRVDRYSQTVTDAVADAHTLILCAWSGEATGQAHMRRIHGMTRARWEWGCALLRYASIARETTYWQAGINWRVTDLTESIARLEAAAQRLQGAGSYTQLRAVRLRLNRR